MLGNKRLRMKELAMLLAVIIYFTPIYGVAAEAVAPVESKMQMTMPAIE